MTGRRSHPPSPAQLVPLGAFLLAALVGCQDHDLPTALGPEGPVFSQSASAPVVNSLADDGTGCTATKCTLRDAIAFAYPGGATITFEPGLTGTIVLSGSELSIENPLTIVGPGATSLAVSGNNATRVLEIDNRGHDLGITVSISGLTIRDGLAGRGGGIAIGSADVLLESVVVNHNRAVEDELVGGGDGGGIVLAAGTLTLRYSSVTSNTADGEGGGIFVMWNDYLSRSVTLDQSTVSGNSSGNRGGGISNSWGTVEVLNSTVSGNTARYHGGGIRSSFGTLILRNSTVSGNITEVGEGGGIWSATNNDFTTNWTEIINSTISGNHSDSNGGGVKNNNGLTRIVHSTISANVAHGDGGGGGVYSLNDYSTRTDVKGSIIWGNTFDDDVTVTADDVATRVSPEHRFVSLGYNLIGAAGRSVDFTQEFNEPTDRTGVADARLGALALNAPGTTSSHALLAGSPALDAAGDCHTGDYAVTADQRGVSRPQGSACDIGAYELEGTTSPDFASACTFTVNPRNGQHEVTVTWENAVPGVTLIHVMDGRTVSRQMHPTQSGSWSTKVKDRPTYAMWGGENRRDTSVELVEATGGQCMQEMQK